MAKKDENTSGYKEATSSGRDRGTDDSVTTSTARDAIIHQADHPETISYGIPLTYTSFFVITGLTILAHAESIENELFRPILLILGMIFTNLPLIKFIYQEFFN